MGPPRIEIDCSGIDGADAGQIDRLARLALEVRRQGGRLRLRNAAADLTDLVDFCGLSGVLPGELKRQPEEREEACGVEEEGELPDPGV